MITKDIEELAREKHILETDIAQKEADIKIKNGEIKSLQVNEHPPPPSFLNKTFLYFVL